MMQSKKFTNESVISDGAMCFVYCLDKSLVGTPGVAENYNGVLTGDVGFWRSADAVFVGKHSKKPIEHVVSYFEIQVPREV